jgi:hypothetical protein
MTLLPPRSMPPLTERARLEGGGLDVPPGITSREFHQSRRACLSRIAFAVACVRHAARDQEASQ